MMVLYVNGQICVGSPTLSEHDLGGGVGLIINMILVSECRDKCRVIPNIDAGHQSLVQIRALPPIY